MIEVTFRGEQPFKELQKDKAWVFSLRAWLRAKPRDQLR